MYITNNAKQYPCTGYTVTSKTACFIGVKNVTLPLSGTIQLVSEDADFELSVQVCEDYARQTYENGVLTLTNEPEPIFAEPTEPPIPQPTIEERTTALEATQSDVVDILASALGVTI